MSWLVVKFTAENSVEVVPASWFNSAIEKCCWPPQNMKKKLIYKMIKEKQGPMRNWALYEAKLLGTYDNFQKAEEKTRKAMVKSDLSSTENNTVKSVKRRRTKNRKYFNSSNSSVEESSINSSTEYPALKNVKIATMEKTSLVPELDISSVSNLGELAANSYDIISSDNLLLNESTRSQLSMESYEVGENGILETLPRSNNVQDKQQLGDIEVSTPIARAAPKTNVSVLNDAEFKTMITTEISVLHLNIDMAIDYLSTIARSIANNSTTTSNSNFDKEKKNIQRFHQMIPVKTVLELRDLENWLKESENYSVLVADLLNIRLRYNNTYD